MSHLWKGTDWESWKLKEAWRGLLLSRHHDCWIVPYNGAKGETWADKVRDWTFSSNRYGEEIISCSAKALASTDASSDGVLVFNTLAYPRKEIITVTNPRTGLSYSFHAEVPAMGYAAYLLESILSCHSEEVAGMVVEKKGKYVIDTDKYRIVINPRRGGAIESLKVKELGNNEFINKKSPFAFNTLRGYFTDQKKFVNSSSIPAKVSVLENTPLRASVRIEGEISGHPYSQTLSVTKGGDLIDCELCIDWKDNVHIGKETVGTFKAENPVMVFYDDRYKLHLLFPSVTDGGVIDKNAPLDVCRSREENTFFRAK